MAYKLIRVDKPSEHHDDELKYGILHYWPSDKIDYVAMNVLHSSYENRKLFRDDGVLSGWYCEIDLSNGVKGELAMLDTGATVNTISER